MDIGGQQKKQYQIPMGKGVKAMRQVVETARFIAANDLWKTYNADANHIFVIGVICAGDAIDTSLV